MTKSGIHIIILFFTFNLGFAFFAYGNIITVKQDGTGDYTKIQDGILAATNGDTVLVYPGTYYENIDFSGKNITVASLNLITGDRSYIFNTIIDGSHNGSCVLINKNVTFAVLYGFTLINGSGHEIYPGPKTGGGVFVGESSNVSIFNCIIKNNSVTGSGGGIYCGMYASVYISGLDIFNNHCYMVGGGLMIGYEANCIMDTNNLSNIYLNYSSRGCDVFKASSYSLHLAVDTFTVLNPDTYYVSSVDQNGYEKMDVTFSIQHQKIIPADTNLYVNPVTGNDTNSGFNPDEPLKTIAFANTKLMVDSLIKNTIFLANGIYSDTLNGEKFPLNIRPFTNYKGQSMNGTILDAEYKSMIARGNNEISNYGFSKMTFKRGTYVNYEDLGGSNAFMIAYLQNDNIFFDSLMFTQGHCEASWRVVSILGSNHTQIKNCVFSNNKGDAALDIAFWERYDTCWIKNCIFFDNQPDFINPDPNYQIGRALSIDGGKGVSIVSNSLFYDNDWNSFIATFPSENYLVNCTFTGNGHLEDTPSFWLDESTTNIYNCIIYNEGGNYSILMSNVEHADTTRLNIYNSLTEGGEQAIHISPPGSGWSIYHYDDTNINTDPMFYGGEEYPYNLSDNSPCIDAGTLDLPDFIELPDKDLAGNPRIFNDKIDMGAYEWDPTVGTPEYRPLKKQKEKHLKAAPNPFDWGTYITAKWEKQGNVRIEVYNNGGLRVKILKSGYTPPGQSEIQWIGDDENNNYLPAGVYHVVMYMDGKEVECLKVVKK